MLIINYNYQVYYYPVRSHYSSILFLNKYIMLLDYLIRFDNFVDQYSTRLKLGTFKVTFQLNYNFLTRFANHMYKLYNNSYYTRNL